MGQAKEKWLTPCSHFMQSLFVLQFIVQQLLSDSDSLFLPVPYDPTDISPHLTTTARLQSPSHYFCSQWTILSFSFCLIA